METAKDITDNLISRVKSMEQKTVVRELTELPFRGGEIPFDVKHKFGEPCYFYVYAVSQEEAETTVDNWLAE